MSIASRPPFGRMNPGGKWNSISPFALATMFGFTAAPSVWHDRSTHQRTLGVPTRLRSTPVPGITTGSCTGGVLGSLSSSPLTYTVTGSAPMLS